MEETLLGFLCSATKRIVQIKQMCDLLARNAGSEIAPGFRRLPTFAEIANGDPSALDECKLGFRAKYHFGPDAGLAQQFLFSWERRFGQGKTI